MILIPEIETVVILVPRTGSSSLRKAIAARYNDAMQIYRHMEADGVPHGYDRWRRVGVVRDPVERLWSLYKFVREMDPKHPAAYRAAMAKSVEMPFDQWIRDNQTVFTNAYDSAGGLGYHPGYAVNHSLPENRKSQYLYLRPDLGTVIYRYTALLDLQEELDIAMRRHNQTELDKPPILSAKTYKYIERMFEWDLQAMSGEERTSD